MKKKEEILKPYLHMFIKSKSTVIWEMLKLWFMCFCIKYLKIFDTCLFKYNQKKLSLSGFR